MYPIIVKYACYGALTNDTPPQCQSVNVQKQLQKALNSDSSAIEINNTTMGGDPSPGNVKHFGALISQGGEERSYNCGEGQTIDFS